LVPRRRHSVEGIPVLPSTCHDDDQNAVERIQLPHQPELEEAFGEPLDHLTAIAGDPIAQWLDERQANAATLGNVIWLPDPVASIDTVAHEVVHALQTTNPDAAPCASTPDSIVTPQDPAETEASRLAANPSDVSTVRTTLAPGMIALRRTNIPTTPSPKKPTNKDTFVSELEKTRPPVPREESTADRKEPAATADETTATTTPAGIAAAAPPEQPSPAFTLPEMPETALSPEEQAARQAQLEAAQAAIAQADSAEGVVGAYADAPPTVKAATQSIIGGRIHEVIAADQQKFESNLPDLHVTTKADEAPPAADAVTAPELEPIVLEADVPPPAPEPDLPRLPPPPRYQENREILSFIARMFGAGAARAIAKALGDISTDDPFVDTYPGPKPTVPLEGDTDPSRLAEQKRKGQEDVRAKREEATQLVIDGRGPEQVQLRALDATAAVGGLPVVETAELTGAPEAEKLNQMALPEELLAQFDQDMGATMQANLQDARAQFGQAEIDRDQQRDAAVTTAEQDRDRLMRDADGEQRQKVREARETIQTGRQSTVDQQKAAVSKLDTDAELARKGSYDEIDKRVRKDEDAIAKEYDKTEEQAKARVTKGEQDAEAARVKAEKESEEESWWDKAVGFVEDVFDALTSFINDVFDAVRSFVNDLIDAVRDFAKGLIDLAADFIKGAITAFGEALKGLVDITIGQVFPELADKLNEKIDGAVATANEAVDAVANKLKAGIDAVADTLKKAVNFVIDTFQAAVNTAIAFVEATITGDWGKFARKLLESILHILGIDPADFYAFVEKIIDTLDIIIDDPLGFLGHLVDAVVLGFQKFADHFLDHLKVGIIKWLTGALGGIQIPKDFDIFGVLDLARQIAGLSWEWLRAKAVRLVGEKNVARLEFILSYVQTLIDGGFPALWARITQDLGGLVDMVIGAIKEYLVENIIIAGIKWIAVLFTPVGALIKLIFTIWNLYKFVRDQLQRIIQIAKTIVDALANLAHGIIEDAAIRIETALANLLPVAIDLVAKLLDLGGVSAKVREIIQGIRDWIDEAVNKLLDRVLKAFTGKGEAEDAPAEGESIGERLIVDVEDGPDHVLTIAASGTDATVMLASDPLPVARWLDNFAGKVGELKGEEKQKNATQKIDLARAALSALDPEADALLAAKAGGSEPPAKTKEDVNKDEENLRDALAAVFKAFGVKDAAIIGIFAAEITAARDDAQPQIKKALRENETTFQTMKWEEIRPKIAESYNPFQKPILKEHVFGRAAQKAAAAMIPADKKFETKQTENFLGDWLARLINNSEGSTFAAARIALQNILFDKSRTLESSAELKAAVDEALIQFETSGDKPDADLVAAVSGKITEFLTAVATNQADFNGLNLANWETVYWGKPPNQAWLKDRFRGAGGKHEWIPTNYIEKVVARGRASADPENMKTAAAWVTFQDELRSPTEILMYPPEGRYARTVPFPRDPVSHVQATGAALSVIQGHVGAVYAPVREDAYSEDVIAQTRGQGPWHDDLRKIFDSHPGTDLATMRTIVQELTTFVSKQIWKGEPLPNPGFTEYYSGIAERATGKDLVTYDQLKNLAAGASTQIENDFQRARAEVRM
jgi:hypothetical protein